MYNKKRRQLKLSPEALPALLSEEHAKGTKTEQQRRWGNKPVGEGVTKIREERVQQKPFMPMRG